jgi:predicted glycosyltransferase
MKFWIDILTAKQARFFKYFAEKYPSLITSREYSESITALNNLGIKYEVIGKHGKNVTEKLIFSIERSYELLKWFLKNNPKALIHHGSVEASRICFQAGKPIFDFNDSPESVFASRLTAPLATLMIVPKGCGDEFKKLGAQKVIEYNGLTPVTWLKRHEYNYENIKNLIVENKINVIIREPAYLASHIERDKNTFNYLVNELRKLSEEINLITLERYVGKFVDVPTLLTKADIVIATGSIIGEALVSGVPLIIDYLPIVQKMYERFVRENMIIHATKSEEIIKLVKDFAKNPLKRKEPLYNKMEDPLEIFDDIIKKDFPYLLE